MPDPSGDTSIHVRAALAGDDQSLSWLVEHLSPLLLAQARWRLGPALAHACDPEDLVQEAWLVGLSRLRELRAREGRITPVLLRFLSTCILQRVNNLARAALRGGLPSPASVTNVSAQQTGVVTAAIRAEQRRELLVTIDALDEIDRQVLLLRSVEQRSQAVTAELLGISGDAVAMRLVRALGRLQDRLPESLMRDLAG